MKNNSCLGKVYFFSNGINIKIGYTSKPLNKRINQLNTGSDNQLFILGYIEGDKKKEKELHQRFSKYRLRENGEWFEGAEEIIDFINNVNQKTNIYVIKDAMYGNKIMTLFSL